MSCIITSFSFWILLPTDGSLLKETGHSCSDTWEVRWIVLILIIFHNLRGSENVRSSTPKNSCFAGRKSRMKKSEWLCRVVTFLAESLSVLCPSLPKPNNPRSNTKNFCFSYSSFSKSNVTLVSGENNCWEMSKLLRERSSNSDYAIIFLLSNSNSNSFKFFLMFLW